VAGVRIDSGLHAQSEVTPYYDSMVAKVIGFGRTRAQAVGNAHSGLEQLRIEGVRTNGALLSQILRSPEFNDVLTTRFLEQHFDGGPKPETDIRKQHVLAVAAAWSAAQPVVVPVWDLLRGFRVTEPAGHAARSDLSLRDVSAGSDYSPVVVLNVNGAYELLGDPGLQASVQPSQGGSIVNLEQEDQETVSVFVRHSPKQGWFTWSQGRSMIWDIQHELVHSVQTDDQASQEANLSATLPGRISEVVLQVGQRVTAGDSVLTLEAMKLYHTLTAPLTGVVQKIHVQVGDIVSHGQLLVEFEPEVAAAAT